jgi:predicted nucleic acid-binding protein
VIIVDTNLVSEMMRAVPSESVRRWFDTKPGVELYTTSITQAEVLFGIERMPQGKRRESFASDAAHLFEDLFESRVLAFDSAAARHFAIVLAEKRRLGFAMSEMDAQIAAIAISSGAALATRNTRDFENCGLKLINPWNYSN